MSSPGQLLAVSLNADKTMSSPGQLLAVSLIGHLHTYTIVLHNFTHDVLLHKYDMSQVNNSGP